MPDDADILPERMLYVNGVDLENDRRRLVGCTRYFTERWLRLLGPTGTAIVLALRSRGFFNPTTGELRNEIELRLDELSALVGVSVDTLARELSGDKKRPANKWLARFVAVRKQSYRDSAGQVRQGMSVFVVAMTDPVHEDDEAAFSAFRDVKGDTTSPEPQNAVPACQPEPQNAEPEPHFAERTPHFADALKSTLVDSSIPRDKTPLATLPPQRGGSETKQPVTKTEGERRAEAIRETGERAFYLFNVVRLSKTGNTIPHRRRWVESLGAFLWRIERNEALFTCAAHCFFADKAPEVSEEYHVEFFTNYSERYLVAAQEYLDMMAPFADDAEDDETGASAEDEYEWPDPTTPPPWKATALDEAFDDPFAD